jgi:hypothetical protein
MPAMADGIPAGEERWVQGLRLAPGVSGGPASAAEWEERPVNIQDKKIRIYRYEMENSLCFCEFHIDNPAR